MENKKQLLNMDNARRDDQRKVMQQIIDDGVCPFCEENFEKYHPKPILFKTKYWIVTENAWPYDLTKNHFLLVYRPNHLENSSKMEPEAYADFSSILKKLEAENGLDSGTLLMRFGDMSKTGASVKHIHAQIVQGDPQNPDYDPKVGVMTRVG